MHLINGILYLKTNVLRSTHISIVRKQRFQAALVSMFLPNQIPTYMYQDFTLKDLPIIYLY